MKNIALLTSDINLEYCLTIFQGIYDYFHSLNDVHLIITQIKSKNDIKGTYSYQYGANIDMIEAQDIDGYIILSTTFGDFLDELVLSIRKRNDKPILSIGVELFYDNCYSTSCNTRQIYREIVTHLVKKHDCKNIGFFSAKLTNSDEAKERYESYLEALKFNSLEYNPDFVLDGNFTRYMTKQVIESKYKSKEEVPFDAIICANDLTALGCIESFSKLGISIPDELKIIGFDDTSHASLSEPSISTINQQLFEQGKTAAQLIYNKVSGIEIEKHTEINLRPVYRQSCGCIKLNNKDYVYKNQKGKIIKETENYREYIKNYYDRIADTRNIYVIFDFIHSTDTMETFVENIDNFLNYSTFKGMSISLFDKPIYWMAGDNFELPDSVKLVNLVERTKNLRINNSDSTYDPNIKIIPEEYNDIPGFFILQPVYNCSLNYGYFLCHFTELKLELYSVYLKIINQAIAQAAEFSRSVEKTRRLEKEKETLQMKNSDLAKQSKTDELTKILNRRGFMDYGQQLINLSVSMETSGAVFFADLDGLKKINDNYGHEMGDTAIQLAAIALRNSFRKSDIIGRLSGDEFAVVATDMSLNMLQKTREKLDFNTKKLQEEHNLPFTLSLSLGGVCYSEESYYLKELLIKADESLYEEKRLHHERMAKENK